MPIITATATITTAEINPSTNFTIINNEVQKNTAVTYLHCVLAAAQCIVIGPVCVFVGLLPR